MKAHTLGVLLIAAAMLLPASALAGHITHYRFNPVEHDDQGRSDEPDFLATRILGPALDSCNFALPVSEGFVGWCTPGLVPLDGQSGVLAPGCTGEEGGQAVRRVSGQCGLWTVGAGYTSNVVPPGTVPPPVSERGMGGDRAPGAYTPTKSSAVRFLDTQTIWALQPPAGAPNIHQVNVGAKFGDIGRLLGTTLPLSEAILPGSIIVHVWYGEWRDLNGNGVIDHFSPGSAGANLNEYAWLGNCLSVLDGERKPASIANGICIEDPNPNAVPPGKVCADPQSTQMCAMASISTWLWPGDHGTTGPLTEAPANQIGTWLFNEFDCVPACEDVADPLLGRQDNLVPDIHGNIDSSGEPDDTIRRWYSGSGAVTSFYGDDGLLVTLTTVTGVNCYEDPAMPTYADPTTCTFMDVDRHDALHPAFEQVLIGPDYDHPNGGLKGAARAAWLWLR